MKKLTAITALTLFPYCAFASLFDATITVIDPDDKVFPPSKSYSLDTANNFFDQIKEKGFSSTFEPFGYTNKWGVKIETVYQGVPINVTYNENSKALIMDIPSIGLTGKTFNGTSRNDSNKQLEKYLRNDIEGTYSKIIEKQVSDTGTSQVAGNPTSLQGQLVSSSFNNASNANNASTSTTSGGGSSSNPFMAGVGGGTYTQKGVNVSVISVPVSKGINIDSNDQRKKLLINGQFNYITVDQASSFQGTVGLGYMHPITDHWYLIPSINYGAIGSQDLASLGQIFSTSLSSKYDFDVADYHVDFVNMFGFYKTLPLSIGGVVSSDPTIENYVFKNGIFPSKIVPFLFGHDVRVKGIFTDTEFTGTKVFVRQYNEVGIELSSVRDVEWLKKASFGLADSLSLSGKYVFSIEDPNNFEGYDIGISYDF